MTSSSTVDAENEPYPHSPTESVVSTLSSDGEVTTRNIGKKSLAEEIEDVLERENRNRDGDTQTVTQSSVGHKSLGRPVEDLTSEITFDEILKIQEHVEKENWDALGLAEPINATTLVAMVICCLVVLGAASYTY